MPNRIPFSKFIFTVLRFLYLSTPVRGMMPHVTGEIKPGAEQ